MYEYLACSVDLFLMITRFL